MLKTFFIQTYGCAMNTADANSIRTLLMQYKLNEIDDWKEADIVILVTCSIRQQAEDKVAGWGIKANDLIFNNKIVILTGCMAQRYNRSDTGIDSKYTEQLKIKFPWITHIINILNYKDIPKLLNLSNRDLLENDNINYYENNKYQGLFSISHGCNNFCSYCIVPYARGELINYPKKDILDNIKDFISEGGKLITLLGQNVNSWEDSGASFVDLLKDIEEIDGEFWINFISSHPKDFSDELIELITTHDKFLKHCNIAVQSGSDRVLKLMNRGYSVNRFRDICKKIYKHNPEFRITTDVIVGFPTESDIEFNQTVDLIDESNIQMVYIGKYSPREGTVSSRMVDEISLDIKKSRELELKRVVNIQRLESHKYWIGKTLPVLFTSPRKGITYYNHEIKFSSDHKEGEIESIEVIDCSRSGLVGK